MKTTLLPILILFLSNFNLSDDYPIPAKTKERLFYIQRNHNSNTIVYDANFNNNGLLNEDKPVDVYWIRYEEDGQRMELRTVENKFAYGVDCKKVKAMTGYYNLKLVADKKRVIWLKQIKPDKAIAYTKINRKTSILDHLYIQADNSGIWPDVEYIELFGYDVTSGKKIYEKILNN